jgi:tetratricopeptide (TPR) repeat protein
MIRRTTWRRMPCATAVSAVRTAKPRSRKTLPTRQRHTMRTWCRPRAGLGPMLALGACLAVVVVAAADEIHTTTHARYVSVRIEDVQNGKILFRDAQGRTMDRAVTEVGRLNVTGWEAFNRAETSLATGQYRQAAREFEAILRDVEQAGPDAGRPRHRRELVLVRLTAACDAEGRFDRAVDGYISLCKEWGTAVAGLEPRNVPAMESAFYTAAMAKLSAAVREAGQTPAGEQLRRYEAKLTNKPTTQPATQPPKTTHDAKTGHRPQGRSPEADVQLAEVARWVDAGDTDRAAPVIRKALDTRPPERLAPWYYWQGRCIEASAKDDEARLRAALAYMRVPVHYADAPQCAECLYRAAMIHIQTKHADRAAPLLREALRHSPTDEIKRKCEAALAQPQR